MLKSASMIPGRLYSRKHNVASTIEWNKSFKNKTDNEEEQLELDLEDDQYVDTTSLTSILGPSTISISNLSSQTYTVGTGGGWTTPSYTYNTGTISTSPYSNAWSLSTTLNVEGDAEIKGELTVQGVNLASRLDEIEKRLAILRPNNDLENKWQELQELGEKYRELEKEILEKEQIWDTLKK